MSVKLDNTYGAAFIGMVIAAVLHGVSCVQALYYYTHQNDNWYTKHAVTAVMIFETLHQALITHSVYTYTITDWGNPGQLQLLVRSLLIEVIITAITALIVQSFLTLRIWRLSKRNIYVTSACAILAVAGFVVSSVYVAKSLRLKTFTELVLIKGESISINVLGAATDLLIAGTLCFLLNFSRTGFRRTDAIINKLIIFTVNTGLLTSLCALASLISILAAPHTFIYVAFFFCLGRLYSNSLLATLNARRVIAGDNESQLVDSTSVSLQDVSKNSQGRIISVKIDTTKTEYGSDTPNQKLGDESSEGLNSCHVVPYDQADKKRPLQRG